MSSARDVSGNLILIDNDNGSYVNGIANLLGTRQAMWKKIQETSQPADARQYFMKNEKEERG